MSNIWRAARAGAALALLAGLSALLLPSAALAARHKGGSCRVVLVGLDGATWDIYRVAIDLGLAPVMERVCREGASGVLRSESPLISPRIWTTIATGMKPEMHGILDFTLEQPKRPYRRTDRQVEALWNMASGRGRSSQVVGWYVTMPADGIRGLVVTDMFEELCRGSRGTAYPERLKKEIFVDLTPKYDLLLAEPLEACHYAGSRYFPRGEKVTGQLLEQVYRELQFLDSSLGNRVLVESPRARALREDPGERVRFLEELSARFPALDFTGGGTLARDDVPLEWLEKLARDFRSLDWLAHCLAKENSTKRTLRRLVVKYPADYTAVILRGIDMVCHFFWGYFDPSLASVGYSAEELAAFGGVIPEYYAREDRYLGEVLGLLEEPTVLVVVSDHGFVGRSGYQGYGEHVPEGIVALYGPPIRRGVRLERATIYDVAPTVFYLLGLPIGRDMPGRLLLSAIEPRYLAERPPIYIDTYETPGARSEPRPETVPTREGDEEVLKELRRLGYIE